MNTVLNRITKFFISKNTNSLLLGRWKLKHNCKTEDIIVHNANMDHCGDVLCGDPKKYSDFNSSVNKKK